MAAGIVPGAQALHFAPPNLIFVKGDRHKGREMRLASAQTRITAASLDRVPWQGTTTTKTANPTSFLAPCERALAEASFGCRACCAKALVFGPQKPVEYRQENVEVF